VSAARNDRRREEARRVLVTGPLALVELVVGRRVRELLDPRQQLERDNPETVADAGCTSSEGAIELGARNHGPSSRFDGWNVAIVSGRPGACVPRSDRLDERGQA
jgi:hypothetical protein